MKIIIGLGNPGSEYRRTRHNVGRLLVESLANQLSVKFSKKIKLKCHIASAVIADCPVHLVYPNTYMNHSGQAIKAVTDFYSAEISKDLLILVDDVALPFGKLRLRTKGSTGGHNGLGSIEKSLGSSAYPRLRIGIGLLEYGDEGQEVVQPADLKEFVLEKFSRTELKQLDNVLENGRNACYLWVNKSMQDAMNIVNA